MKNIPNNNNQQLQEKYNSSANKHAGINKKMIPYLIVGMIIVVILSIINTMEAARPFTTPLLMILLVIIFVVAMVQSNSFVKSYHNENIAQKLKKTGRQRVGIIRSILWRPLWLLTIIIVVGLALLIWVSDGSVLTIKNSIH